uniref:Uncharacterized protein n=1 Tax=Strongyloides venezuelensis TaxID=75913 RepID=A0A0K0FMB9_STRVS
MDHLKKATNECKNSVNSATEKTCNAVKNFSNDVCDKGSQVIENAKKTASEMVDSTNESLENAKKTISEKISPEKDGGVFEIYIGKYDQTLLYFKNYSSIFLIIIMNCLSAMKNILKSNNLLKSKMLFPKEMSSGNNNYTLRVDIKNPSEAGTQNVKSFNNNVQKTTNDKTSKKMVQEDINKPFGTNEYNYTLTSASSIPSNSSIRSKRM